MSDVYVPAQAKLVALADLHQSEWNPKLIKTERMINLMITIARDPKFLWSRAILAQSNGTIYAGHQRQLALIELWKTGCPGNQYDWTGRAKAAGLMLGTAPAILEDVDEITAKERALIDNNEWGQWQEEQLSEMLYEMEQSGSNIKLLGFDERELEALNPGPDDALPPDEFQDVTDGVDTNTTCPKCGYSWTQSQAKKAPGQDKALVTEPAFALDDDDE